MAKSASQKKRHKIMIAGTGKKHQGRKGRGAGGDTHIKISQQPYVGPSVHDFGNR